MNIEMNSKAIKAVFWPGENQPQLMSSDQLKMHLSATYHGDHDEFWIVVTEDGKETARHNPRYVETIEWDEQ